jgi:hypothetical protein
MSEQVVEGSARTTLVTHLGRPVFGTAAMTDEEWRGFATEAILTREARAVALKHSQFGVRASETDFHGDTTDSKRPTDQDTENSKKLALNATLIEAVDVALGEMEGMVALFDALIRGIQQKPAALPIDAATPRPTAADSPSPDTAWEPVLLPVPRRVPATGMGTGQQMSEGPVHSGTSRAPSATTTSWGALWARRVKTLQLVAGLFEKHQKHLQKRQSERERFRGELFALCYGEHRLHRLRTQHVDSVRVREAVSGPSKGLENVSVDVHLYADIWLPIHSCDWGAPQDCGCLAIKSSDIASRVGPLRQPLLQRYAFGRELSWRPALRPLRSSSISTFTKGLEYLRSECTADFVGLANVRRALLLMSYQQASRWCYERLIDQAKQWHRGLDCRDPAAVVSRAPLPYDLRDVDERGFTVYDAVNNEPLVRIALETAQNEAQRNTSESVDVPPVLLALDDLVIQTQGDLDTLLRVYSLVLRIHHGLSVARAEAQWLGLNVDAEWSYRATDANDAFLTLEKRPYKLQFSLGDSSAASVVVCSIFFSWDTVCGCSGTSTRRQPCPIMIPNIPGFLISNVVAMLQDRGADALRRTLQDLALYHELALLPEGIVQVKVWPPRKEASPKCEEPIIATLTVTPPSMLRAAHPQQDHAVFKVCWNDEPLCVGQPSIIHDFLGQPLDLNSWLQGTVMIQQ